jgi:cytochrome c55X
MLLKDCGSCHGENLKGGMGPALLPENLKDKPIKYIVTSILTGHPNTPMPAWHGILTEDEVDWIAQYLLKGGADL